VFLPVFTFAYVFLVCPLCPLCPLLYNPHGYWIPLGTPMTKVGTAGTLLAFIINLLFSREPRAGKGFEAFKGGWKRFFAVAHSG
jgi:hypothetical protein